MTAAISNSMVALLHRYTGRGPTRARTTIGTDIIVCVMGATLTKGEQSLVKDDKAEVVLHSRRAFQDTMQADAIAAVQELCGRRVVAFMSNNHIDPDLAVEVFILEPTPGDALDDDPTVGRNGHVPDFDGLATCRDRSPLGRPHAIGIASVPRRSGGWAPASAADKCTPAAIDEPCGGLHGVRPPRAFAARLFGHCLWARAASASRGDAAGSADAYRRRRERPVGSLETSVVVTCVWSLGERRLVFLSPGRRLGRQGHSPLLRIRFAQCHRRPSRPRRPHGQLRPQL
jgi:uncharacterized protein YbcI